MTKKLLKIAFLSALGEGVYVMLVSLFMQCASRLFGPPDPNFLGFIVFILVFVLSAAVSGALILGKPILMYLDGKKKEAVTLFAYTLMWIMVLVAVLLASVVIFR